MDHLERQGPDPADLTHDPRAPIAAGNGLLPLPRMAPSGTEAEEPASGGPRR
jgi:hypothetical protein